MGTIRAAIIGVGNCASSLIQGIEYYKNAKDTDKVGLMNQAPTILFDCNTFRQVSWLVYVCSPHRPYVIGKELQGKSG